MGYDISFHPISEKQMKEWYFDVVDDFDKARLTARACGVDEEDDDFYEEKYIEILELAKNATTEKSFENTHGYYIANIQGIFQEFFYTRGSAFSFIEDSEMDKYYKNWEDIIPSEYKEYTIHNEIQTNYHSGKFIPYDKVCQLLEDYTSDTKIKSILDEQFSHQRIEVLLDALSFAKEHGVGLLESDGVMEPNPLDLNESTCYSNLFNCDIKGPLLYQEAVIEQLEEAQSKTKNYGKLKKRYLFTSM